MEHLSFRPFFPWTKYLLIYSSFLFNLAAIVLIIFILGNSDYPLLKTLEIIVFIVLYTSLSSIFHILLFKSKTVQTDKEYLYIKQKEGSLQKVHISCIDKLERKYYYFYKITFKKECMVGDYIYVLISLNPSFSRPKKFHQIMGLMKK